MKGEQVAQAQGSDLLERFREERKNLGRCVLLVDRPAVLKLRTTSGDLWAFPYGTIRSVRCKGNCCVILEAGSHTLRLTGLRLAPVFDALCQHTVCLIQTDSGNQGAEDETAPVVDSIRIFDGELSDITD